MWLAWFGINYLVVGRFCQPPLPLEGLRGIRVNVVECRKAYRGEGQLRKAVNLYLRSRNRSRSIFVGCQQRYHKKNILRCPTRDESYSPHSSQSKVAHRSEPTVGQTGFPRAALRFPREGTGRDSRQPRSKTIISWVCRLLKLSTRTSFYGNQVDVCSRRI